MLSTSPDHPFAASPPGPSSSQSSSTGSCYSSTSSQASLQARPTLSDPSSSSTSPASAYDRASEQRPFAAPLTKRPAHSVAVYGRQSSSAPSAPFESSSNETFTSSRTQASYSSRTSPRVNPTRSRAMERGLGTTYDAVDPRVFHHAGPSNIAQPDHSTQGLKEQQSACSPDKSRGPAPKTRRTSPGGSRASGNLAPSHESSQHNRGASTHSPSDTSRSPSHGIGMPWANQTSPVSAMTRHIVPNAVSGWSPARTGYSAPDASAGPHHRWQQVSESQQQGAQASQASTSAMPAPRTRTGEGQLASAGPLYTSDVQAPALPSPPASSRSMTDCSETLSKSKPPSLPRMDLATFPPQELLKILATLLHEIATANDEFQPDGGKDDSSRSRRAARSRDRSAPATPAEPGDNTSASATRNYAAAPGSHLSFGDSRRPSVTTAALGALATPSSTLCFHARNVPSISIESYLLRILKYCPTTNEVFLSLLVYFDRMSRMGTGAKPGANGDGEVAGEAAGLPRAMERATGQLDLAANSPARQPDAGATSLSGKDEQPYPHPGIRGFAIDSYNVHRLVIAGVTVASKFFSDVFYTNSRYAKVGGLPPHELNQLELQFLLLNDFRLTIPLEEMQRYADQLLMYGNGRPEMVNMVKEVSSAVAPTNGRSGPSSSTAITGGSTGAVEIAANAASAEETAGAPASADAERGPASSAGANRTVADAGGDVQMADA